MKTQEIKIEKNVPIPSSTGSLPFDKLEVGDSFFLEGSKIQNIRTKSYQWKNNNGKKEYQFKSKVEGNGVRTWRTK